MAIENAKLLNVRIKNKYDSYDNWASSGLILEAGEIAIAYTSVDVKVDNGTAKHPALLMKVGDGVKTFANLPWLSAKAADVLSVCKNEDDLKGFVNGVIADAGIASDEAMEALAGKVTTAEGAIDALEALVGTTAVQTQISNAIAALNLAETYAAKEHKHVKADIEDFAHGHVMADVVGLADALAGKQDAGDYADEVHTHVMADITDLADELAKYQLVGDYATKAEAQVMADAKDEAIAAAKKAGEDAQADVDALELVVAKQADVDAALALKAEKSDLEALVGKVGSVTEGSTVVGMIEAVDGKADDNADAIEVLEGKVATLEANGYDDTEVRGLISANAGAIEALEGVHTTDKTALESAIALKADQTALQAEIDRAKAAEKVNADAIALLTNGVSAEEVDGVNDLIQYVKDHGAEVTGIKADIQANADAIAALEAIDNEAYKAADATLKSELEGKIALKADASVVTAMDTAYKAADTAIEGRLDVLEAIEHDAYIAADTALENKLNVEIAKKADSTAVEAIDGRLTTAEGKLTDIAEGAEVNVIEVVKVNGKALTVTDKAVDVLIPTGALASKDKVAEDDLVAELAAKINGKAEAQALTDAVAALEGVDAGQETRIAALEAKFGEGEGSVADMVADAQAAAAEDATTKADAAEAAAKKYVDDMKISETYATKDELDTTKTELTAEIDKKANDEDLAPIAKSGSTDDLVQGLMTLVLDCGGASEEVSSASYSLRAKTPSVSSGSDGIFESDGSGSNVTSVEINGQTVDPSYYTIQ